MKGFIYVISFDFPYRRALLYLLRNIKEIFGIDVRLSESSLRTLMPAYNRDREQFHAGTILGILNTFTFPHMKKLIAVLDKDIYEDGMNFIFGEAVVGGTRAVVSSYRLRTDDEDLFNERLCKEVNHELGHTFGLKHCHNKGCVMNFSNSVMEVDLKSRFFCRECSNKLRLSDW